VGRTKLLSRSVDDLAHPATAVSGSNHPKKTIGLAYGCGVRTSVCGDVDAWWLGGYPSRAFSLFGVHLEVDCLAEFGVQDHLQPLHLLEVRE
jgi:hypothetical protein